MTRFRVAIALACIGFAYTGCASKGEPESAQAAAAPAGAPAAVPMVESTATSLNIRATASPTGAVVGSLKRGEHAGAPQPEAGGWQYVESASGAKGYVASKYVKAVAASAAPAPAAAAPAAAPATAAAPAEEKPAESAEPAGRPAPQGSKLAKVTLGMTEPQVVEVMGAPTTQQNYVTGKAFIPFYYGPDTSRLDYRYKGVGIIVFTRNRYSNQTEVIRTDYDPSEDGVP